MPVTAKLSLKFYERFGDEIANELVEWFNAVDETYQRQLKDVNDLNWQRVETRFGAFDERLDAMTSRFDEKLGAMASRFDEKLDAIAGRFDEKLDAMAGRFDERLDAVATRVELVALEAKFDARLVTLEARLDSKIQRLRSELIMWMFGFWTATVVPLAGLMLAVSGAFRQ